MHETEALPDEGHASGQSSVFVLEDCALHDFAIMLEQVLHVLFGDVFWEICDVQVGVFHVGARRSGVGHFEPLVPVSKTPFK